MKPKKVTYDSKTKKMRSLCTKCKDFFSDGEEVLLCPVYDAPHHRKCWIEKKGCSKCGFQEEPLSKKIPVVSIFKTIFLLCLTIIVVLVGVLLVKLILIEKEEIKQIGEPTAAVETFPSVTPLPPADFTEIPLELTEIPLEITPLPVEPEEPTQVPVKEATEIPLEVIPYGQKPPSSGPTPKPTVSSDGTYSL